MQSEDVLGIGIQWQGGEMSDFLGEIMDDAKSIQAAENGDLYYLSGDINKFDQPDIEPGDGVSAKV